MISRFLRIPSLTDGTLLAQLRRRRLALILALTGLLAIIGVAMISILSIQRESRNHALHELRSIQVLRTILESVLESETSQRGYLLTGKASYLEPFATARQTLADARSSAVGLIAHSPFNGESASLDRLDLLIDEKLSEIDETVALARSGKRDVAMFVVETDFGKRRMDAIRAEIGDLSAHEELQLTRANERAYNAGQLLIPLVLALGLLSIGLVLVGLRAEQARAQVEAEAEQAGALREANVRADLLVRELNHRVKNLFSIILSIISLASRRRPEAREFVEEIKERIHALSRAHAVTEGPEVGHVDIGQLIGSILAPYSDNSEGRISLAGPAVRLPARSITPMGLVLHELATNAVKYGALSQADGTVRVQWDCSFGENKSPTVAIRWTEEGSPVQSRGGEKNGQQEGFGTSLIDRATTQLGGTPHRTWGQSGLIFEFTCQLDDQPQD